MGVCTRAVPFSANRQFLSLVIREQAILAIRNLLENNKANQDVIRAMEPRQVLDEKTLDELGFHVDIDDSGRVKFRRPPSAPK